MTKVMMCDPPSGWKYGFPKPVPDHVDDIRSWLLSEGYPQAEIDACGPHFYVRYWTEEDDIRHPLRAALTEIKGEPVTVFKRVKAVLGKGYK